MARASNTAPTVKLEAEGVQKAALDLREVGVRARDLRPLEQKLQRVFQRGEQRVFSSRDSGQWPALLDSTLERKARAGQSDQILRATDRLYRSLTSEYGSDEVSEVTTGELEFGTSVPYAVFLRAGSESMAKRDPVDLRPSDLAQMTRLMSSYIAEGRR